MNDLVPVNVPCANRLPDFQSQGISLRPIINAHTHTQKFTIFCDTGSPVNLMPYDNYLLHFSDYNLIKGNETPYCDIHGKIINIIGEITLSFFVNNIHITENVKIVNGIKLAGTVLLGCPAMARNNIIIDPKNNRISCRGQTTKFKYASDVMKSNQNFHIEVHGHSRERERDASHEYPMHLSLHNIRKGLYQNKIVPIYSRHRLIIQSEQNAVLSCKIKGSFEGKVCITLPESMTIKGLTVESGLHNIHKNTLFICIHNNAGTRIEINKGNKICDVEVYNHNIIVQEEMPTHIEEIVSALTRDGNTEESRERISRLKEQLHPIDYPQYLNNLIDLLQKYSDVVALKGDSLGKTHVIKHHIAIPKDTPPMFIPAYRLPHSQREKIEIAVRDMLAEGIIEESMSPWSFPLLCIPKKDGQFRIVVDFRKLNNITIHDPFPMPSLRDLISTIGQNMIFSTVDLLSGFHQIMLDDESKPMTGFSTESGHYNYCRMPFGLKSSPTTFVRMINIVFKGLLGKVCIAYIDDLIILGKTIEEHFRNLELVLKRLQEAGLKIKLSKCTFLKKEITYLGHTLTTQGIKVNDEKVRAITRYPRPTSAKEVKSFIGLTSFYRIFVQHFSRIASPLTDLLKQDTPFVWTDRQEQAFNILKEKLSNPPILAFPQFDKEFILVCDASDIGIGSCLMQYDNSNKLHPVAYYSRKLSKSELNYSVTDKESLSVVNSLKNFRFIILGYKIKVFTDHTAVTEIFKNPSVSGKRARWSVIASDFDIEIKYIPGRFNCVADSLSRNIACIQDDDFLTDQLIKRCQDEDKELRPIKEYLRNQNNANNMLDNMNTCFSIPLDRLSLRNDILVKTELPTQRDMPKREITQIVIPKSLINKVIRSIHDARAHPGRDETLRQARLRYFWISMRSDIITHVQNCHNCHIYKGQVKSPNPIQLYPIPHCPFDRVAVDLITNLTETAKGYRHILVCIDALTRFTELIPLKSKTAKECAESFYQNFILRYTAPKVLISDNGLEFNNKLMNELCLICNTKKVNIMAYQPAANGLAERTIRRLLDVMRQVIGQNDPNWDNYLPTFQNTLNNAVHQSIKEMPFYALYGIQARTPTEIAIHTEPELDATESMAVRINNSKVRHRQLHTNLVESSIVMQTKQHRIAKQEDFKKGDLIYLKNNVVTGPNYKLAPKYTGPYEIQEKINPNKYVIRDVETHIMKTVHADKMKLFRVGDDISEDEDDEVGDKADTDESIEMSPRKGTLRKLPRVNYSEL